jgi:hypothetical protein
MLAATCATLLFLKCFINSKIVFSKNNTLASVKIKSSALDCSASLLMMPALPVLPGNSINFNSGYFSAYCFTISLVLSVEASEPT